MLPGGTQAIRIIHDGRPPFSPFAAEDLTGSRQDGGFFLQGGAEMNRVVVVTDSNVTIPKNLVKELDIRIVPLLLTFRGQTFRDGVDITPGELYRWLRTGGTGTAHASWGEEAKFEYEIDNRWFSTYSADVQVSLWHNQKKLRDLVPPHKIAIAPFDKERLKWVVDTVELEPSGSPTPPEEYYRYVIIIKSGETERKISLYIW